MGVDVLDDPLLCCPPTLVWDKRCLFWCDGRWLIGQPFTVLPPPPHCTEVKCCLFWCDGRGRFGRRFPVLPLPPRLNSACFGAMGADLPLLCFTPALRLGSVLPITGPFYCGSCGPSFRCPSYRQQPVACLPVRKRATWGRLWSSTRPNLDAHETGRARSRSRDSRRGEPPEAGSGDETEDGPPYHHPDPPTKRVDSPVRAEKKTDQPPPDSGASRRQLSPAPGESHQTPPPRSTGHHRRHLGSPRPAECHPQSSRDRGAHASPLCLT